MRITTARLKQIIREEIETSGRTWMGDEDPRPTPPEREFVNGPDAPAGYIVVRDKHEHRPIAWAPIVRTDGPDRPFLVRTTDTNWEIPHWIVELIYPRVEDAFNDVDSREDWRDLGPGSKGERKGLEWEWVASEPISESRSVGAVRLSKNQLKMIVESVESEETVKEKLVKSLQNMPIDSLQILRNTDPAYGAMINNALDSAGIEDKSDRDRIYGSLVKQLPVDISGLQKT